MPDPSITAPVVDVRDRLAARALARTRAVETYDAVTMSLVLMLLLDGEDADAREMLADSSLTADDILELGAAGARLGEMAPRIVKGRRR